MLVWGDRLWLLFCISYIHINIYTNLYYQVGQALAADKETFPKYVYFSLHASLRLECRVGMAALLLRLQGKPFSSSLLFPAWTVITVLMGQ